MNVINFTGRVGGNAETRFTKSGKAITSFSVALDAGWGDNKTTTWMRCNLWGERGQKVATHITKGSMIGVSGEFSTREWQNNDNQNKTSCEVNVNDVTLLGGKDNTQPQQKSQNQTAQPTSDGFGDFNDDIPF